MRDALLAHLDEHPELYLEETSVRRTLVSAGWSKKKARPQAAEQHPDLIDYYLHQISPYQSWQCIFVDESGCDTRDGLRRTAWSPRGVTPVQITKFRREERYQILPAYSQDGILLSRIHRGCTDSAMFEDFIGQLLCHCGRFPEPNSVLIMDNASFHRSERINQMCRAAGVKLIYLALYSPRLNPIEEFFAELNAFIKRHWKTHEDNPDQGFAAFLEWCVDVVGEQDVHQNQDPIITITQPRIQYKHPIPFARSIPAPFEVQPGALSPVEIQNVFRAIHTASRAE